MEELSVGREIWNWISKLMATQDAPTMAIECNEEEKLILNNTINVLTLLQFKPYIF